MKRILKLNFVTLRKQKLTMNQLKKYFLLILSLNYFAVFGQNMLIGNLTEQGITTTTVGNVVTYTGATSGLVYLHPTTISNQLNNGKHVVVISKGSIEHISSLINKSSGADCTLTLRADNEIMLNVEITGYDIRSTSGKLNVVLWAGNKFGTTDAWVDIASDIDTNGGHVWIGGGDGSTIWNGLTVGDDYAYSSQNNSNGVGVDFYNSSTNNSAIKTNGGDLYVAGRFDDQIHSNGGYIGINLSDAVFELGSGDAQILGYLQTDTTSDDAAAVASTGASITGSTGNLTIKGETSSSNDKDLRLRTGGLNINWGSGSVVLQANYVVKDVAANYLDVTAGSFTYEPSGTAWDNVSNTLNVSGTVASNILTTSSNDFNWLILNNLSTSSFTLGKTNTTSGISLDSTFPTIGSLTLRSAVNIGITQNVTVNNKLTIASGGEVTVDGNLTSNATSGDGIVISGKKIAQDGGIDTTTSGASINYTATGFLATSAADNGLIQLIGVDNNNLSVINANGGNIVLSSSFGVGGATQSVSSNHDQAIAMNFVKVITSGSGQIQITADATNNPNTSARAWGIEPNNSIVQSQSGNITISTKGGASTSSSRGFVLLGFTNFKIISSTGEIKLLDNTPIGLSGSYSGLYLQPAVNDGFVLGADGINLESSSSNISIIADKIRFVSNPTQINTSGTVTIESEGSSFGSDFIYENINLQVIVSSLRLGKSSNSTNITLNSDINVAGPVTIYGGDIAINSNLTTTGSGSMHIKGNTIIAAGKTITSGGNFTQDGDITFKSNATGTAAFGSLGGTYTTTSGTVQVERYIPSKRAFRLVSSSVTTSTTIRQNWQEDGGTTAGLGTHITGTGGATNGFDVTSTNNPSLFGFNHNTGQWAAVTNTNVNNLTAGTPYRLMVRGDRNTDLTANAPASSVTTLRTTGALHTGNFTPSLNQAAEGFSFIGNPYQAPLDMEAVLTNSATNMNTDLLYYWDPTLNVRGAYVTRTLSNNSNNVSSSFTEILQPGQAVFVKKENTATAATMTISETHKSVANGTAGVFRSSANNTQSNAVGLLRANLQATINNEWQTTDAALALFATSYTWDVTQEDATKMNNLDEEVSFVQNNTSLAIAKQNEASVTDELPIRLQQLRHTDYRWVFDLTNYSGNTPYLLDTEQNTLNVIENGTVFPFTAESNATNRFKIVFQNSTLSTDDFSKTIKIYPNPAKAGDSFYISDITEATVSIYNVVGQNIPVVVMSQGNAIKVTPTTALSQGIYLVSVTTTDGKTAQVKWIVE